MTLLGKSRQQFRLSWTTPFGPRTDIFEDEEEARATYSYLLTWPKAKPTAEVRDVGPWTKAAL